MLSADKLQINITFLCMIPNKMMPNLNVFGPGVWNGIFGQIYCTGIIIAYRYMVKCKSIVFKLVLNPQYLSTTAANNYVLSLCS